MKGYRTLLLTFMVQFVDLSVEVVHLGDCWCIPHHSQLMCTLISLTIMGIFARGNQLLVNVLLLTGAFCELFFCAKPRC